MFTRVELDEIDRLCTTDIIAAKRLMAYEITKLVHGEKEADNVMETIQSLFGKTKDDGQNAPESDYEIVEDEISVLDLFVNSGMVNTKSEIRRLILQNGASIDGVKCNSPDDVVTRTEGKDFVLLQKGKKVFLKVRFAK